MKTTDADDRIIGSCGSSNDGPLLIVIAGIHGNEKAGIRATRRVLSSLEAHQESVTGRFVGIIGNLAAGGQNRRFIDEDLNRMWAADRVERLWNSNPAGNHVEEREQRSLIELIESEVNGHHGEIILLDLHSTSAHAPPFCIISDTLRNRRIAFSLSVPVVLGLEEAISGTIQEFFGDRGYVTAAIEGGQHDDPATADFLEAALRVTLSSCKITDGDRQEIERHHQRLRAIGRDLPTVVEVTYRHGLNATDDFRMEDGFCSFSPVRKGQRVARDRKGDIHARTDGLLILPSYQPTGDDGFFVGRPVRVIWLRVSALVRRLGLDRLVPVLPGVRRHPGNSSRVLADPRVARWLVLKVFHLFGFRRCESEDGYLVFRRRPERPFNSRRR